MRTIEWTGAFKRDFKREKKGQHGRHLDDLLEAVVTPLANDVPLEKSYADHPLSGEWKDHRDCHVRPDLVLIYRKPDAKTLQLVRLGSHAEVFGS
jgi:mRNA interferase YafQ